MNYQIKYLPTTIEDRAVIRDYLCQYYESTAKNFFVLLKKRISQLKEFPYSCPVYEDDPDYRRLVVGDYLVFYIVNEDNKVIEIHRIFHGTQDIRRHLR
ncbi:MAG: type II toxin-antitoxin system RelE/ParE family toxin [Defluviitaleaceae bacterium]|nr:type II toxin-antitoxin system RelE/ParE family toxin [Defluviitaleaceae bacterium]